MGFRRGRAIASDDLEFVKAAAAWAVATNLSSVDVGLSRREAALLAKEFISSLHRGRARDARVPLDDATVDVLRAACASFETIQDADIGQALQDADFLFDFISGAKWPEPDFEEKEELLCVSSFAAWRLSRRLSNDGTTDRWRKAFSSCMRTATPLLLSVREILARPVQEGSRTLTFDPARSETLLALCELIRDLLESSPTVAKQEAEFLHRGLDSMKRPAGVLDEHQYFLGESALLVGIACRMLARREEAIRWFDMADSTFRMSVNSMADRSRVNYHRLALCLEERRLEEFFKRVAPLSESFRRLGMSDEALKCEILKGLAQMEVGELEAAERTFRATLQEAESLRSKKLVASSYVNLVHVYGMLAKSDQALRCSERAIPILKAVNGRVALAQIQLGLGSLLRARGEIGQAVEAYRAAQMEFGSIGMSADVAATNLMIADLLLDLGREALAVEEILEALPVIDEFKLVPEGMAALSLLRESVRQERINRQALRDLHGYFEETKR